METTYYTLNAREILVSGDAVEQASGGGARQYICVARREARPERPGGGKVIDLAAWKADREEEARLESEWYDGVDERLERPTPAEPRERRDHSRPVLVGGELLATLSVVGAMAVLVVRMLGM